MKVIDFAKNFIYELSRWATGSVINDAEKSHLKRLKELDKKLSENLIAIEREETNVRK